MVQAKDFTYNGTSLSDICEDFILVEINGSKSDIGKQYFGASVSKSGIRPITNFYEKLPSDVLKFSIAIAHEGGEKLTADDITTLNRWLLSGKTPKVGYFTPYDEIGEDGVYTDVDYIGVFTNAAYSQIGQVGKISVEYDFENISPYAFSKEKQYTVRSETTKSITITGGGSSGEVVVPEVTIIPTADGTVTIKNDADSAEPFSVTVTNGQKVIVSDYNMFTEDGELYDFSNAANLNFPLIADGVNRITVTGTATVIFKLRFYVNIGV